MAETIEVHMCGPSTDRCLCKCPEGPCEHVWDGEGEEWQEGGSYCSSTTCSRCGMSAMSHSMWVGP